MKKIFFLLLFTIASYGQAVFDEGIQIKNNTTDNSATKVNVQSTDGTINTISKSDLVNVVEVNDVPSLPLIGEAGKIYVVKNVSKIYRWNGTFYQELAVTDISGLQAQLDLKANTSEVVKLTGNQTISGQKSFSLTGKIDMQTDNAFPAIRVTALGSNGESAAEFINNSSSPYSTALRLQTDSSGGVGNTALNVSNQSSVGTGIVSNASNGGVSISSQSGDGDSYISNITLGGTGRNYVGRNNGTETYSVDKTGNVLGNSYIKRSTPANNILLAGGGDLAQGTAFNKNFGLNTGDVVGANTLLNQYSTTPVDWTATAFNSGQVVFYGGKQWIAKMATVAGDVPAVSPKWEEITFEALANKTVTVDQTIIDGSTNAVSGNAVFDGLALKSNIGHTHVASQITDLSKASVGLGNVDNTSDLNKPISTATQTALISKEPAIASGTISQYWRGDKTWQSFPAQATVDQTIIDGSTKAVSGNAVFDALATKAPISSVHNPVTIGTANGLSLATQQLSLGLASSSTTGALSGTDWNTFNGKFNTPTGLTTNYLPKWKGSGFGNSGFYEDATGLNINGVLKGITFDNPRIENTVYSYGITHKIDGVNKWSINIGAGDGSENYNIYSFDTSKRLVSYKTNGNIEFIPDGSRALFNTTLDNGVDKVQVAGTISASPATTANQVPTWGQVQAFVPSGTVNLTGNQTISGVKTFSNAIIGTTANFSGTVTVPDPINPLNAATKQYVDAVAARPYKVYTALYSQSNTSNPTVVILENTLGTVTFTRSSNGVYLVNSSGLFTADKTFVIMGAGINANYTNAITLINSSTFYIITKVSSTQDDADSANTKVAFEIRVYL